MGRLLFSSRLKKSDLLGRVLILRDQDGNRKEYGGYCGINVRPIIYRENDGGDYPAMLHSVFNTFNIITYLRTKQKTITQ